MTGFARALRLLDEVQHLAELEAFDAGAFVAAVSEAATSSAPGLAELGRELDGVRGLLGEIDRFAQKAMRIRLNQVSDAVPAKLRTLVSTTLAAYERDPALLRARVRSMLERLDPATAATLTEQIGDAAERVLATRATLRRGVIELAQRVAAGWLPATRRAARDRSHADEERDGWRRARVDLERIAAHGEAVDDGSTSERLARIAPPADEPAGPDAPDDAEEPETDPTAKRFSLLEID